MRRDALALPVRVRGLPCPGPQRVSRQPQTVHNFSRAYTCVSNSCVSLQQSLSDRLALSAGEELLRELSSAPRTAPLLIVYKVEAGGLYMLTRMFVCLSEEI